jgi:hypothetical protein
VIKSYRLRLLIILVEPRSHNLVLRKPRKLVSFGVGGSNPSLGVLLSKWHKKIRIKYRVGMN